MPRRQQQTQPVPSFRVSAEGCTLDMTETKRIVYALRSSHSSSRSLTLLCLRSRESEGLLLGSFWQSVSFSVGREVGARGPDGGEQEA